MKIIFDKLRSIHFLWIFSIIVLILLFIKGFSSATYVGSDNDDIMRLVEVRDLIGGQGWFDMMQYRLGQDGVDMHWSRLVDFPLATLILFFNTYFSMPLSEQLALLVWPLLLACLLLQALWNGSFRVGGKMAACIALILAIPFFATNQRFTPGAIDHHNLQLVLVALVVAMLIDAHMQARRFAIAGAAVAGAVIVGAETMPLVIAAIASVYVIWAVYGLAARKGAIAFGLALAGVLSVGFLSVTPQSAWLNVTCDNLSFGFWSVGTAAGLLLFASAMSFSGCRRWQRFGIIGFCATIGVLIVLRVAPHCLAAPLADLDPMLRHYWLDYTSEAQSFVEGWRREPGLQGLHYAVGFLAMLICAVRIVRDDRRHAHIVLFVFLATAWIVALIQVRGAVFANLLAIFPLSALLADLRRSVQKDNSGIRPLLLFYMFFVLSVPLLWGMAGLGLQSVVVGSKASVQATDTETAVSGDICYRETMFASIRDLPPERIAAPSDVGAYILSYTKHRALSAPYHRNQHGMVTVIKAALADPREAKGILREAGATLIGFCAADPQTAILAKEAPNGLFAQMLQGNVPAWLSPLPASQNNALVFYRIAQADGEERSSP